MAQGIKVDYDQKTGRFLIKTPFNMNGFPKSLPNRKWDPKQKVWTAPAIRGNVMQITGWPMEPTSEANMAIIEALDRYITMNHEVRPVGNRFPIGYPFKTKPRPKQMEVLNRIYGIHAVACFMDMRTGKTKVSIDLASALRMQAQCDAALIICPLSIRKNWLREIAIHAPFEIDAYLLDTSKPKAFDAWMAKKHDFKWLVVGVESLAAGSAMSYCERFLRSFLKALALVDEASKIKNASATRAKNAATLGRMAAWRMILTGTPIANGPIDLFQQFEFLDPEIIGLGDYYSFRNQYCIMGGYVEEKTGRPTQIIGYQNLDELMEIIAPYVVQVRKQDVFPDAPPKIYITREVELNKRQRELYNQMRDDKKTILEEGTKELRIKTALEKMLRLQQITSGIVAYQTPDEILRADKSAPKFIHELIEGENPKLTELLDVIEEYDGPTIIWCAYRPEIKLIVESLREKYGDDQVVECHGGVDEHQRDINVNVLFQGSKARFLVGNAATGAMGLTMTAAEVEIYVSNTFNYIDREQSEERAFGPDKKNGTVIIDITANKTVDQHIVAALLDKKSVAEYVRSNIDTLKAKLFEGAE